MHFALAPASSSALPIHFVRKAAWEDVHAGLQPAAQAFAAANGFTGKVGQFLALPDGSGGLGGALFGIEDDHETFRDPFRPGQLAALLPKGTWRFANTPHDARLAALAFALHAYRFARYRKNDTPGARLALPEGVDGGALTRIADSVFLARDLINTPANDLGPQDLDEAVRALARPYGADIRSIVGDDLLKQNLPLIHAVGKASARAPRLIDMTWGDPAHPKVTLVGKGVCFDTGGLDIKPSSGMLLMKKDMGGAAAVIALARMVMDAGLKVRLRVLIPAVENAIDGNAFRPLDVYPSRKGLSVEIGNTDAEGRLVLADALTLACEDNPDLLIDLGTLTGAARVALGPDLPPFYTRDDVLAADIARCARAEHDPLWRLPLWHPYDAGLDSKTADLGNIASGGFAGSIVCALFLQRFVRPETNWLHVDIYGWTPSARPGRPEGGECQAARAIFRLMTERYA